MNIPKYTSDDVERTAQQFALGDTISNLKQWFDDDFTTEEDREQYRDDARAYLDSRG